MKRTFRLSLALCLVAFWGMTVNPVMADSRTIKIGVIYPLTGSAAAAGRELRDGAKLAEVIANYAILESDMDMAKNAGIKSLV